MQEKLKKIIKQVKTGDQKAFGQLVEMYRQYAFILAFRILCDEEEARDTVQDSFVKIWKNIKEYEPKLKFTTWMYSIVTNTAIDRLRAIKRHKHVHIDDVSENRELLNAVTTDDNLDNKELGKMISLIADGLPEKQRLVFVLRELQGLGSAEVETILHLPETSVKSNLYHARKFIRERLNKIINYERSEI